LADIHVKFSWLLESGCLALLPSVIAWSPRNLIVHHLFSELWGIGFETLAELGFKRCGTDGRGLFVARCHG
jgi:hypothetical protein